MYYISCHILKGHLAVLVEGGTCAMAKWHNGQSESGNLCSSSRNDHITLLLQQLHWLRAPERIQFKLTVYKCMHGTPSHLTDKLQCMAHFEDRRHLCPASLLLLAVWLRVTSPKGHWSEVGPISITRYRDIDCQAVHLTISYDRLCTRYRAHNTATSN